MEGAARPATHEIAASIPAAQEQHPLYTAHLRQLQQLQTPLHPSSAAPHLPLPAHSAPAAGHPGPPPHLAAPPASSAAVGGPAAAAAAQYPPASAAAAVHDMHTQRSQLEPFSAAQSQFPPAQSPQPGQPGAQIGPTAALFRSDAADGQQASQQRQQEEFLLMQQEHQQFQFQQQLSQKHAHLPQQGRDAGAPMQRSPNVQRDSALYRPQIPGEQAPTNQLFVQQHGYSQLGQQQPDRSPQAQHQQQSRSLLQHQPQGPMPGYPQNGQFVQDGNRFQHQGNYMLHQSQQIQMPDDFSSGHPRAATNMVNFPTPLQQQFSPRYAGVGPGSTMDSFSMNPVVNAEVHQADSNALARNDALYRPLVPGAKLRPGYGKPPGMVGLQDMSNDAQLLLSPRPKPEATTEQDADASKKDKQGTPTKKDQQQRQHLQSPGEGVPSTVVADPGSATDIDGSLIARLRGFSHVSQGQKQHMLGQGLPHNLFPASMEPQAMGQPQPGAHPEAFRTGIGGMRSPTNRSVAEAGNMLSPQRGMHALPGRGQLGMGTAAGTAETAPERPFRCKFCQASFGRRDNMQKHMRSIHMGERPFVCEICSYAFQKKDHKDKHVRTVHLKERPYRCNLCESRFGQKSDLTKHIRTVHQRIKPFRCEHCGLSFGHRGNKLRHVFVVHQKRKPHVCSICRQAFGERSNLAKHSLAVHKHALK